jgi:predicted RecA/RadA family phage recombinase
MCEYSATGRVAGEEGSSTYEGRHLSFIESDLTHPAGDGLVNKGDPCNVGSIVGVAFKDAAAATDIIAIDTEGIWYLNVVASNDSGTSNVVVGDELYVATGVVSKKSSGTPFGKALSALTGSASPALAAVKVHCEALIGGSSLAGHEFAVSYPSFVAADVAKGFFIAPAACAVISAYESHSTVAGQAGILNIEKCNTGEAAGAGDVILATGWDLTATTNTPVTRDDLGTGVEVLVAGDQLRLRLTSGAATSLAGAVVTVRMIWI